VIDGGQFALFLTGALILNVTPGPDMAFTLASGVRGGPKAGIAAAAGIVAGSLCWTVFTAAGLAALLAASDVAFHVIRFVGGAYLLYLAVKTWRARTALPESAGKADGFAAFRAGLFTNLFNPKVGLFFLAFLPAFTHASQGPVALQILALGTVFSVTGGLVLLAVAYGAGALRARLARSQRLRVALNATAAAVFGALGLRLLLARAQ
jgi:threonine/homoserine/homoserine lactone efflux protein